MYPPPIAATILPLACVWLFSACSASSNIAPQSKAVEHRENSQPGQAHAEGSMANSRATSPTRAAFALSYQPSDEETHIARAQARVGDDPDAVQVYVDLAEAFLLRRRESGDPILMGYAMDALRAATDMAPTDREVRTLRLHVLMDEHKFQEVRDLARALIDPATESHITSSTDTTPHLLLSDALLELGQYDQAVDVLQTAMDMQPDLRSYSRAAYLRWLHGDEEGALDMMQDALELAGQRPESRAWCYVDMGHILWQRGDIAQAKRAAERALALVPGYLPALALEARILAAESQSRRAIAMLTVVVERRPTVEDLTFLSELLEHDGRASESQKYLARAESMAPHDPLPLAMHYARHNKYLDQALALAESALKARDTIFTQNAYAMVLLRQGRIEDAASAMAKAMQLGTPDTRMLLHHGLIEARAGRRDVARKSLRQARKRNPYADPKLTAELEHLLENG